MEILKKERNYYFDNLKGFIIILVVMFHIVPRFVNFSLDSLYGFVSIFHMAFFILISGYFSKNKEKQARKAFSLLIIYYVLSLLLYVYCDMEVYRDISNISKIHFNYKLFLQPFIAHSYVSWYILVLCFYRAIYPSFPNIKYSVQIAFIVGIIASLIYIPLYSIRRMILLLPFFATGYYLSKFEYKDIRKNFINRKISFVLLPIVFLIFILFFIFLLEQKGEFNPLYFALGEFNLEKIFNRGLYILAFTIICYILAFGIIYLISTLMTDEKNFLSKIGKNSLAVYFFHSFFTITFRENFLIPWLKNEVLGTFSCLLITIVVTSIIVFVFSRDIVTKYTIAPLERLSQKILIRKD
ncbi:acyltransferase family protein [Anaerofustis stercorihominis]|uniref:acyltransferase family protein n=1 Tax=Anaerofustis stercorihominis TaxID=214853 RepID=UPI00214B0017|nr:acyltransferase family protein [Anaerofustis stercorihominis]MCR2033661.1 acyltransferase family protein [Anaerofustis stercorihominis]